MSSGLMIWNAMVRFADDIQAIIDDGWIMHVDYGESRLGIADKLIFRKDDQRAAIASQEELSSFLESLRYCEETLHR